MNDKNQMAAPRGSWVTDKNIVEVCVYLSVRKVIPATWLNDRDQFLYPNDGWQTDHEFQTNCLAYTLFHNSNNISSKHGVNHWIPFTEYEVNAKEKFASHFMTDFFKVGPLRATAKNDTLTFDETDHPPLCKGGQGGFSSISNESNQPTPLQFSPQSQAVFDAGRELWKYYHSQVNHPLSPPTCRGYMDHTGDKQGGICNLYVFQWFLVCTLYGSCMVFIPLQDLRGGRLRTG